MNKLGLGVKKKSNLKLNARDAMTAAFYRSRITAGRLLILIPIILYAVALWVYLNDMKNAFPPQSQNAIGMLTGFTLWYIIAAGKTIMIVLNDGTGQRPRAWIMAPFVLVALGSLSFSAFLLYGAVTDKFGDLPSSFLHYYGLGIVYISVTLWYAAAIGWLIKIMFHRKEIICPRPSMVTPTNRRP